jgi:hypothetical protein
MHSYKRKKNKSSPEECIQWVKKKETMKKLILFSLLVAGSYGKMFSQQPGVVISDKAGWHKIGETTVDFKTEREEIMVMGADKFSSIKIKVDKEPIRLESFDIYFENGGKQTVSILKEIKSPGETGEVKIEGGERSIKKIAFTYKTMPNPQDKRAHLELWGYKSNADKKVTSK